VIDSDGLVRRYLRRPPAVIALAVILVIVGAAAFASVVAPYPPNENDLSHVLETPSRDHLLGTDSLGRDVLSRLIYGFQAAIGGVVAAVLTFVLLGVTLGLVAGYVGGRVDRVLSGLVDIVLSIPAIIIMLVVIGVFPNNQILPMIVLGGLVAASMMRVVRAATLAVRSELFIDAAKVSGLSEARIITRHVLPRIRGPVLVQATLFAGFAVLIQAGLGFLGFGPPPPDASLGQMVRDGSDNISFQPWLLIPTGLAIALTVVCLGLIGDAIRDINEERWAGTPIRRPGRSRAARSTRDLAAGDAEAAALLSARDISVAFPAQQGEQRVVERVSFDLHAGETLGIVGESGCGKTMTALSVIGLLPPGGAVAGGSCFFDGVDLFSLSRGQMRKVRGSGIAMISQEPMAALDPSFTVQSTLSEVIRLHDRSGRAATKARVLELLELVGLPDPKRVAKQYPHQLSGGMAQRVAIAVALAGRPKVLIADEPTTALDVTVQAEILGVLRSLCANTHLAVMLVTHDWGVVADICQRVVVMYAGQVVESGPVAELVLGPLNPYTEGLLHSNPADASPRQPLVAIPGAVPQPHEWPSGCRFAPRCRYAIEACRAAPVELVEFSSGRSTRCIRSGELARLELAG
jgi:peptide/nickel transport system permease protein